MLRTLALVFLLSPGAFGQSFDAADVQVSAAGNQPVSMGILPDGEVRCRNVTLKMLIAAAYDVDRDRVAGGPDWLDSARFDIAAHTAPTSRANLLRMMQALLVERFKLVIRRDTKLVLIYALAVGKNGPQLQPAANSDHTDCPLVPGPPNQLHRACKAFSMADLAQLLPQTANSYLNRPVVDLTALDGSYDFQLDWMSKARYDEAVASKDPMAVSIFDAVAKLGLVLEKRDDAKDAIVVESAERVPVKNASGPVSTASYPELTPGQTAGIDRYVQEEMAKEHIPGVEVGIYRRGQILLAKGYGLANVELNVAVKPETVFQSGSVGKQFVSAAVMMLVEEGKMALDDSLAKYFPNAPDTWKPILIKNLLSHTSGLAEYETPERIGPKGPFYLRLDFNEGELLAKLKELPIEFKPGEKWNYRNTNYVLLGMIIHKVTGRFYADYLQERIFKPWYMTSTRLISDSDIIPNRSSGYQLQGDKLKNQDWVSPTFNSTADGTLYFNVLDLAKWDEALYGTSLLKQASLDRIWTVFPLNDGTPNPAHYGFAWHIGAVNGHKVIEHSGAWQGFTCDISRFVDDSLTVVVLANLRGARTAPMAHMVAGLVNPALMPKQHKEISVDTKLFDGYVGRYQLAPEFILTVTRQGDGLFAQATGQPRLQIFPEGERDYFLKVVDASITFVTDGQGRATELILHQGGDHHAKRID